MVVIIAFLGSVSPSYAGPAGEGKKPTLVTDIFGRPLDGFGLVLLDWEGYLANPAIRFFVQPPPGSRCPVSASLSGNPARLYFDLPSTVRAGGPMCPVVTAVVNLLLLLERFQRCLSSSS